VKQSVFWFAAAIAVLSLAQAQTNNPVRLVGTVSAIKPAAAELDITPEKGDHLVATWTADTVVERVAPGEKDLRNAQPMTTAEISIGDRVLVVLNPGTNEIRRVVVMPALDIAKRDEASRQDWTTRGVSGIVATTNGNQITLKLRGFQGETQATVVLTDRTTYRRYRPDSVKFSDAAASSLSEIQIGDQLRARGQKSEDGTKVDAEEVVFGTFETKAGTIVDINPESREIHATEWGTDSPLTIHLTTGSQIKTMPDFPGPPRAGGGPPESGKMMSGPPGGPPPAGGPGMGPGGPPDMAQMIEHMPAVQLQDLKPGQKFVVSSTKGARTDELTAIMLLTNAEMLIKMASNQSGRAETDRSTGTSGNGIGTGGMTGALQGLDLPGMTP
jgi:hypothetical protein